ncbi:MAG: VOC family protein [Haliea sp.]|nr:MAG: VOC family protein [Haliea sp.]
MNRPLRQAQDRPFKVLGIQQIAIGGADKQRLRTLWVDLFGLEVTGTYRSERENVDEDICAVGSGPFKVEVDLMQPMDPDKKPAVHQTPLNHVGLWIDDLPRAVDWLGANGVRFAPGGIRRGAAGFDICFIHPKGNEGLAVFYMDVTERKKAEEALILEKHKLEAIFQDSPAAMALWQGQDLHFEKINPEYQKIP